MRSGRKISCATWLVAELLPEESIIPATLADDIVFLREYPLLPLAEVPQLGSLAREAYDQQLAGEQCALPAETAEDDVVLHNELLRET